jgi:ribosomal protein RSM22 (predicted rRNA methylase)
VEPHDRARLEAVATRLSETYRAGGPGASRVAHTREDVAAYAAYRAPATYAAAIAVLGEVSARFPGWQPSSVLDVGAGPGVASWAAAAVWPDIVRFTLVETEPEMIAAGRRLAPAALAAAQWIHGDVSADVEGADLVLASYVLGELGASSVASVAARLWSRANGAVALIEPGTPAGYRRVIAARSALVAEGGRTAAPCPHDGTCPLVGDDWCHFATRLPRSEAHRAVKGVSRGFEDEKLSYVVVSRWEAQRAAGRVIRPPLIRSGHVHLDICEPDGIARRIVSRRDKELYRAARDLRWGDAIPPDMPMNRHTEQS